MLCLKSLSIKLFLQFVLACIQSYHKIFKNAIKSQHIVEAYEANIIQSYHKNFKNAIKSAKFFFEALFRVKVVIFITQVSDSVACGNAQPRQLPEKIGLVPQKSCLIGRGCCVFSAGYDLRL
jgi:hypothetical protein